MGKQVTQNDIAAALNLSRVTVSKVFNNSGKTSEKTKQLVYEKARELGYKWLDDKAGGAGFGLPEAKRVVFVCYMRDFNCNFWTSILKGIASVLSKQNISMGIVFVSDKFEKRCELPQELYDDEIDGIIIAGALSCEYFRLLHSLGKPMVSLDIDVSLYNEDLFCDVILAENTYGYYYIVKQLCDLGYRKFAYIGGKDCVQSFRERWMGAIIALQEYGVEIRTDWMSTDGGTYFYYDEGVVERIVNGYAEPPEVIICFNDCAAARINQMKRAGHCPNLSPETMVVGFDNSTEFASHLAYDCNVECFPEEMGKTTADTLIWRMAHPSRPRRIIRTLVKPLLPEQLAGDAVKEI